MAGSVKKDGNSWYYVLELGKDHITGKRKQKKKRGYKTKKEAQIALVESQNEINKGTYIEASKELYSDYLNQWLFDKKTKVRESTFSTYNWLVNKHIVPSIGHIELSKLNPMIIQNLYNKLVNENKLSKENVQKIHSLINNSLKRAERWGLVSRNVASHVERPRTYKKEISVWTVDQVKHFLNSSNDDPLYVAFLLAVTTGMRQGEILGLRWKDISFESESLSVIQTLNHSGKILSTGTKTKAGMRKIALPTESIQILTKYKRIVFREKQEYENGYTDLDLVVCTALGTPVNPRNLLRTFHRLIKQAHLPKIRFHDLRHTHATLLLQQGINPKIVAERLGHTNVRMTLDTYSHLLPSMQQETADKINNILFN